MDVALRDVTDDDLPLLFEYQLDPDATAMAHVAKHNLASRRVLEKDGFAIAGEVVAD